MAADERLSEAELCPPELLREQEDAFARDVERLRLRAADFVAVPCPACDRLGGEPAFEKWSFRWLRCSDCSTLYMSPRPTPEVMAAYYEDSENYRYWAAHIFPASEDARREKVHRPWLERIVEACDRHAVARRTLVEVGPGFGTFSSIAGAAFERVVAIEPTPELAAACRDRGIEVLEARIEDAPIEGLAADVVVAFEVIEHLFEPKVFVARLGALLRPGGLLVLSCPNGLGFDISLLGPVSLAVDPEHVNLFNPSSLGSLLERCGFDVLETETPGRLDAEFVHDAIARDEFTPPDSFLQRVLVDEWDRLGWPFQRFLADNGLSSHMWVTARR